MPRSALAARRTIGRGLATAVGSASNGLLNNLIAYWSLEEASGNRADSHGANSMVPNVALSNRAGKIGNAVNLDPGTTNWLSVAAPSTVFRIAPDKSATISAWVLMDALPALESFWMARWTGSNIDWVSGTNSAGSCSFSVAATATAVAKTPDGVMTTGVWHHVVGWFDHTVGTYGTVYVQLNSGTVYSTALASAHIAATINANTYIGTINDGGYSTFNGAVDEAAFWNVALTAAQRGALYNGGAGLAYSAFTT